MFVNRIRKYLGAYMIELGRVDGIIFTAGIGENSPQIREKVCANLENYGVILDKEKNIKNDTIISKGDIKVMIVSTNEELQIAKEALNIIK
jgi:acetate kinase